MGEQGIQPIPIEHPIKEIEDYSLMETFYKGAEIIHRENEFIEFDRRTGDKGRNDFIFGASDNVMPFSQWEKITYRARKNKINK